MAAVDDHQALRVRIQYLEKNLSWELAASQAFYEALLGRDVEAEQRRRQTARNAQIGHLFERDLVRARIRLHVERPILRTAAAEPPTTPEDTLRAAGVSSRHQARYQRRILSLLAGRS
jgi:hypothetical protein